MEDLQDQSNSQYIQGASDLFSGIGGSFNFSQQGYNVNDAKQFGKQKGAKIGSGIGMIAGTALAPVLGPLAAPVGQILGKGIGGLIGGASAANKAEPIIANREQRKQNFISMYQDIARGSQINQAQVQGQNFINSQYQSNLPSLS